MKTLQQFKLVIDAGGTKTKGTIKERPDSTFLSGPGNVSLNLKEAIKNISEIISKSRKEYKLSEISIFVAGYNSIVKKDKELFNSKINSCAGKHTTVKIVSDMYLPFQKFNNNAVSITLGTGTSIVYLEKDVPHSFFGFGHLIFEPMSAVGIVRRLFSNVFNSTNELQKKVILQLHNAETKEEFLTTIYKNPLDKKYMAEILGMIINDPLFEKTISEVMEREFTFLLTKDIKAIIVKRNEIILNGSVATSKRVVDLFKKEFSGIKIHTNK